MGSVIDFIAVNSGLIVSVLFFTMFVGIALWAYWPSNKARIQSYANIPLQGE